MATGRLLLQIIFGLLYVIILGGGWRWFWIGLWVQGWSWWVWWWPMVLCCSLWLVWWCLQWSTWSICCGGRIFGWVCCDLVVATVVCFFFSFLVLRPTVVWCVAFCGWITVIWDIWFVFLNNYFQFLNNILRVFIYIFTHTYFHKYFQIIIFNF